jgi:hypothetical protein
MEPTIIQELLDYFLTTHKHQLSVIEKLPYIILSVDKNLTVIVFFF